MKISLIALLFVLPLCACGGDIASDSKETTPAAVDAKTKYTAQLIGPETVGDDSIGDVNISFDQHTATLDLTLANIKAGTYAMHLHQIGKCEGPDFKSAGGHWNPAEKEHGRENPKGAHAGDMQNVTVEADGPVKQSFDLAEDTAANLSTLLDEDGAAFMMHARADDMKSDPAGDAGSRIICGVITAE